MESADFWRLCDHVSIFQAIMLILGYDPSDNHSSNIGYNNAPKPEGYAPLRTALVNAVKSNQIEGIISTEHNAHVALYEQEQYIDIDDTVISVESLKNFLKEKGLTECFFFPEGEIFEEYLDKNNPFFAPKLSAAVEAWKAITTNPDLQKGKTPKQALEKWLRENAKKYGLTKDDGTPNETGIQEICKIANWKPEGGASKTPTPSIDQDNSPTPSGKPYKLKVYGGSNQASSPQINWDEDDLPF